MKPKVFILQRRLPQYRLSFFEQLRQRLNEVDVDLTLAVGAPAPEELSRRDEGELDWAVKIPTRYHVLPGRRGVWLSLPQHIAHHHDLLILPHENSLLSNFPLLINRSKSRLAFWGHGANFQRGADSGAGAWLRNWSARLADWWFAYTSLSVERLQKIGVDDARITCVNNAVDTLQLRSWQESVTPDERAVLLDSLGLQGGMIGVALGSLHSHRRLSFLFAAAEELRRRLPDFELIVIGDGPERGRVDVWSRSRSWVHWAGARMGREKVLYASLGRCLLNPGLVGLNILDGFALGLPLYTTDCGIHSPEIAYLKPGINGEMTSDSAAGYATAVERLMTDPAIQKRMVEGCLEAAQLYTEEAMVERFATGILQALSLRVDN